jgi:predicted TIM-barrel fold metal-dependent hydrolase
MTGTPIDRRRFLMLVAATALSGCGPGLEPGRYTQADIDGLAAQRRREAAMSGKGPFGLHRYRGYRGLAELPWFELDADRRLRCIDESLPGIIDFHSHLGMSVLFKPELDLFARTDRVRHLLDCDAEDPGCELDLDIYINGNFQPHHLEELEKHTIGQGFFGGEMLRSHTIPNLLEEMDAMRVEQAVVLPIRLGLPFGDDLTESWRESIAAVQATGRLRPGFSVHPRGRNRLEEMRRHAATGARVMKLHPTVQKFYPDDPDMMDVYALAEELGLVIFFHAGRAGIEPESRHRYALPRHYEGALANFPNLPFVLGHSGARDADAMLEAGLRYPNAWFGTHGQSVTHLDTMIRRTGGKRLLFGTDWPFYHLGASLSKILIVTDQPERRAIRDAILRSNALELIGDSSGRSAA